MARIAALAKVPWSQSLMTVAQWHVVDAAANGARGYLSVEDALDGWKGSTAHNNVILNKSVWVGYPWKSMGVGVDLVNRFYYLWFSTGVDPQGDMSVCNTAEPPIFSDGFESQ